MPSSPSYPLFPFGSSSVSGPRFSDTHAETCRKRQEFLHRWRTSIECFFVGMDQTPTFRFSLLIYLASIYTKRSFCLNSETGQKGPSLRAVLSFNRSAQEKWLASSCLQSHLLLQGWMQGDSSTATWRKRAITVLQIKQPWEVKQGLKGSGPKSNEASIISLQLLHRQKRLNEPYSYITKTNYTVGLQLTSVLKCAQWTKWRAILFLCVFRFAFQVEAA